MTEDALVGDHVAAGRAALADGDWSDARARFLDALAVDETAAALEGLSWAAWWLGDADGCLDARRRAYRRYRDDGARRSAARMALWLGDDHVGLLGADAVARGWFARAARILADLPTCPEHGWLAVLEAHDALRRGALDDAWLRVQDALEVGRRLGPVDLEMFAVATEGAIRVERGEIARGLACLDEAAAAALGGEYRDLAPAAWSCCLVMATCEQVRDYDRAAQWCRQIESFSERTHTRFLRGVCRAHYGAIQAWHGRWELADRELVAALDELTDHGPSWRSEAVVRLGRLRRRQGRLAEAQRLFEQAPAHPSTHLGLAALSLDRDDPAAARDLLERALRRTAPSSPTARADALELLVRTELASGHLDAAGTRLQQLRAVAGEPATGPLTATVRECEGLVAAAEDAHELARDHLEDAVDRFARLGAPAETARARLSLATSLLELGQPDGAEREVRQALHDLGDLDAAPEHDRAEVLLARIGRRSSRDPAEPRSLTDRQVEVLRLVAEGLTDQQIADRLVLSPHTVHRHVANVYTRLGCSSRPAAVAEAGRRGLL